MKVTEVQSCLAMYGFLSSKRVEAIATKLRATGILPKGGRGRHSPHASAHEIALFALAVAGAERVEDACDVAAKFAVLVDGEGARLVDDLAERIAGRRREDLRHIRLGGSIHHPGEGNLYAEVTTRVDGKDQTKFFRLPVLWALDWANPEAEGQAFAGRIGHIGGGVIDQIALEFAGGDDAEWGSQK